MKVITYRDVSIAELHDQKIEVWCCLVDDLDFYVEGLDGIITSNLSTRGLGGH